MSEDSKIQQPELGNVDKKLFIHFPVLPGKSLVETVDQMSESPHWNNLDLNFPENKESVDIRHLDREILVTVVRLLDDEEIEKKLLSGNTISRDSYALSKIGSGESGTVFLLDIHGEGKIALKVVARSKPKNPTLHTDPKLAYIGSSVSVSDTGTGAGADTAIDHSYFNYSDLRQYITLPGKNKEITFMEYGPAKNSFVLDKINPVYRIRQRRKKRAVLAYAESRGLSPIQSEDRTQKELNQNRHFLNFKGEIVVIDIPFWKTDKV